MSQVPERVIPEIRKLKRLAQRWGGDLLEVSSIHYELLRNKGQPFFYEAPFTSKKLGILWDDKVVVYSGDVEWTEVIHEMGHVFASKRDPNDVSEYDWFGWEYALVKQIRGDVQRWVDNNSEYIVGERCDDPEIDGDRSFGRIPAPKQRKLLWLRLDRARELGIVKGSTVQCVR